MGELNKQFEALPLIYQLMDDSFVFVEATQEYTRKNHTEHRLVIATVNGAWYAFQEQQSKIEQLEKKLNAVTNLLNDLKTERKDFKEFDLYDKGYRVTTDYIIRDLEEALRGES